MHPNSLPPSPSRVFAQIESAHISTFGLTSSLKGLPASTLRFYCLVFFVLLCSCFVSLCFLFSFSSLFSVLCFRCLLFFLFCLFSRKNVYLPHLFVSPFYFFGFCSSRGTSSLAGSKYQFSTTMKSKIKQVICPCFFPVFALPFFALFMFSFFFEIKCS